MLSSIQLVMVCKCIFVCVAALHLGSSKLCHRLTIIFSIALFTPETFIVWIQRIQYAKTKSDIVAKADGTFVPRERRKRVDEKRKMLAKTPFFYISYLTDVMMCPYVSML